MRSINWLSTAHSHDGKKGEKGLNVHDMKAEKGLDRFKGCEINSREGLQPVLK